MKKKGGEEGKRERETPSKKALAESQGQEHYEKLKKNPPTKTSELLAKLFSLALQDSRFRNRKENKGRLLFGIFSVVSENFKKDGLFLQDDLPDLLGSKEGLQKLLQLLKEAEALGRKFMHGFSKRTLLESLIGFLKEYSKERDLPFSFSLRYDGQKWLLLVRRQAEKREEEKKEPQLPPLEAPEEEEKEQEKEEKLLEPPPTPEEEEKQLPSLEEEEKEEDVSFEKSDLRGKWALEESTLIEEFINRIEPPSPSPFPAL